MISASGSVTRPRIPAEPSSVVTVTDADERLASRTPKSRSSVAAPSTMSTRHPRDRSCSESMNSGAAPYPPATSTQDTGSLGRVKGRPSGPITSSLSPRRRSASQRVPLPWVANTTSTVPPEAPPGVTRWIENARRSSIPDPSPPTARATKCPGRVASGIPGASRVRWW